MRYEIKLTSLDNNSFIYSTNIEIEMEAIKKAKDTILKNGWEHYGYSITNINKIKRIQYGERTN